MSRDDGSSFEKKIQNRISLSEIRKYKKESGYSYTLGAFPTLELVEAMPERVVAVLVHSSFPEKDMIMEKCLKAAEKLIGNKQAKAEEKTLVDKNDKAAGNTSGDRSGKAVEKNIGDRSGKDVEKKIGGIFPENDMPWNGRNVLDLIPVRQDDKLIERLSDKENVYVVGIFEKYTCELKEDLRHLVLVNPSNMGNLGTIIRTACGFGYYDLAIIEPAADIFNPKTVRASMGSLFRIRHELFDNFDDYFAKYCVPGDRQNVVKPEREKVVNAEDENAIKPESENAVKPESENTVKPDKENVLQNGKNSARKLFPFMLDGSCSLTDAPKPSDVRFSLIFGNEATGLPGEFSEYGCPVRIEQTQFVDSLNLTIAAGIGMYNFMTVK